MVTPKIVPGTPAQSRLVPESIMFASPPVACSLIALLENGRIGGILMPERGKDAPSVSKPGASVHKSGADLNPFAFPFTAMPSDLDVSPAYRALHESAAWIDLSSRGKIRITGEDRARLLHALTTQEVQKMQPGEGAYTFFLNAQGRILGDANLFCFEDHFLLDTEPETRQKLFEHIDRYIIADDATLEDVTDTLFGIGVEGPQAEAVLKAAGLTLPVQELATLQSEERVVARISSTGAPGYLILLPSQAVKSFVNQMDLPQATADVARLVRLEHGRPRYGEEISERYLVQETAQLQAVSFNKGCYLGQEIVERVRSRAQIHRVLRPLQIASQESPAAGTKLTSGENAAGEIASAAFSPGLGKVVALAYIKVQFAEPGTELVVGASTAWVN